MTLESGTHLGPYEILAPLGAGGMGEVYRARDTRLDREVAIKVLPEELAEDAKAQARFQREAKAVAALSHSNIMAIYDVGTEQSVAFAVTELLRGKTLRERIRRSAFPWRKAVETAAAIADGLAAAHAKGITHRDIKPENIFLTTDGVVKILDFGIARVETGSQPASATDQAAASTLPSSVPMVTQPGAVLGTVHYMSPEQVRGKKVDARSDIFSLGGVLYEMVTGQRAFARETTSDTTSAILKEDPPDIALTGKTIPPELDRVIRHCLEKQSEERFQSARDLAFDLRSLATDTQASRTYAAPARRGLGRTVWVGAACAVVTAAVLLFAFNVGGWRERLFGGAARSPAPLAQRIESLAVLPLENLSGDPEQEYFVDGMTDALISGLAKIRALRVISRTSAMRYKGTDKPLPEIAQELNVDAIVEGSVLRAGSRVRISAQLIHAATDKHIWNDSYEHELRDILALQGEVAQAIAREIQVKLTPQEQVHFESGRQVNPEAYEAYIKGRYHWNKRTEQGLNKALKLFRRAIEIDSEYALAHAALAECYLTLAYYDVLPSAEASAKAQAAARRALELDDSLGEAHCALGSALSSFEWNWAEGEKEYLQALRLSPGYATAHLWYAEGLAYHGRHDEALAHVRRARELDPLSPTINACVGGILHYARRYDEAVEQTRRAIEFDPNFALAHHFLGIIYLQQGLLDQAVAEMKQTLALADGLPKYRAFLACACALSGQEVEARRILAELKSLSRQRHVSAYHLAAIHTTLLEKEEAFAWLNEAYRLRDDNMAVLAVDPLLDPLRDDPRFDDLLRRVGFEPPSRAAAPAAGPPAGKIMLAVLPFEDIGAERQEWFSDGMTEEMIAQLGRLQPKKLGVIARTSAMRYKNTDKGIAQIGRELSVDFILEGSVRRAGERVRITASLVNVNDQTARWAQDYDDRSVADVFDVQADVAKRIASALALELLPGEQERLASPRRVDPEAYEAYVKGRYYWNKRTEESLQRSLEYFRQAIDLEPTYALAYVGLADAYVLLPEYGSVSPEKAFPLAQAAAAKALTLDHELGEAQAVLASVKYNHEWKRDEAEHEYRRAIELNSGYATAHHWYAVLLGDCGRLDEALVEIRRAQELDPLSPIITAAAGWIYHCRREYGRTVEQCQRALELDPDFGPAHWQLALTCIQQGDIEQALSAAQTAARLSGGHPNDLGVLGMAYAHAGQHTDARQTLRQLQELPENRPARAWALALVNLALGEHEEALDWLGTACDRRNSSVLELKVNPIYDSLRDHPRFDDLLRRIGLEP